jgi:outer membrane protein OmpA-like peptidoglycan-associated protein
MKKLHFILFFTILFSAIGNGKNNPAFFTMQDSAFISGSVFRTYRIIHDFDKATIRPESFPFLDSFIVFLKRHPEMKIEIGNYTDSRGSAQFNVLISEDRVKNIYMYLTEHGIPEKQLTQVGYGETNPIYSDAEILKAKSQEEQERMYSLNRRTEFKIISVPPRFFTLTDSAFYVNEIYRTYTILWDLGKWQLRAETKLFLDSFALFMIKNPGLEFEIASHTDSRGDPASNVKLSGLRAKSISDYLIYDGIYPERLISKGYGSSSPLIPDSTILKAKSQSDKEDLYQTNRRIEFKIISVKDVSEKHFLLTDENWNSEGRVYSTNRIYFDLGKATIRSESFPQLDSIADFMKKNFDCQFEIDDHSCDYRSIETFEKQLSQQRSDAIVTYLISKGIGKERLSSVGYGRTHPIAPRVTVEKYKKKNPELDGDDPMLVNRRIEIRFVGRINQ